MREVKEKSPLKARVGETLKAAPQAAFRRGADASFQQLRQELRDAAQDGQPEDRYESSKITDTADHAVQEARHLVEKAVHKLPKAKPEPQREVRTESAPQHEQPRHPRQPTAAPREYPPQSQSQGNQSVRESASPIREKPVPPANAQQPKKQVEAVKTAARQPKERDNCNLTQLSATKSTLAEQRPLEQSPVITEPVVPATTPTVQPSARTLPREKPIVSSPREPLATPKTDTTQFALPEIKTKAYIRKKRKKQKLFKEETSSIENAAADSEIFSPVIRTQETVREQQKLHVFHSAEQEQPVMPQIRTRKPQAVVTPVDAESAKPDAPQPSLPEFNYRMAQVGAAAVSVVVVILLVGMLFASPLRILFAGEDTGTEIKILDAVATLNVKEALNYTRKLKLLGIGVQFEEDGINTLAMADEMLLNTFAAIAQEESKSISQNQRLSIVKRMESGEYIASNAPYGYRLIDKKLVIYEPEAEVVRWIFAAYLNGMSTVEIAHELSAKSVLTKGKKEQWKANRIAYILSNEKYDGDTLFQKYYGEETVPFKKHRNYGEMDQFFAHNTHDAILPQGMFQAVQTLLQSRGRKFGKRMTQAEYPLTSRIRCSECGSSYHRKVRSGVIKWVCAKHAADTNACNSSYYSEERIYDGIITMINKLRFCEEDILGQTIQKLEFAAAAYKRNNRAASQLSQSIAELNAKLLALERLRSKGYLAADIYHTQAREIRQQLGKLKTERCSSFESRITTMLEDVRKLKSLIDELEQPLEVFDEKLFHEIVTDICINNRDEMTVTLLGGLKFTEQI